jgi:hypothetical protein
MKAIGFKVVRTLPDGRAMTVSTIHKSEAEANAIRDALQAMANRDFFKRESYVVAPALSRAA